MKPALLALVLGTSLLAPARAAEPRCEVNVNTSVTEAGKKLAPPTHEHPAYYFPVVAGWREKGAVVAGEKPPPVLMVVHEFAKALAGQGYLVVGPKTPPPTLLLVFHWGTLNPQIDDVSPDPENPQKLFYNQGEMLALVGGNTLPNLDLEFEREAVMQGAEDDRYFAIVSAYDFADAAKKKKTSLWVARMSTPSAGFTMTDVVAALIQSGSPLFGRETLRPTWITMPVGREGKVEIGTPTVVPEVPAPNGAPEKKP